MARYFETAKAIVERHGGTVEKFIGDAVMAVFGVPRARGRRAAGGARRRRAARRPGRAERGARAGYGTRLELRIGVNTGEVVTGTEERSRPATRSTSRRGSSRRPQPGEVLLGEETLRPRPRRASRPSLPAARGQGQGRAGRRLPARRRPAEAPGAPPRGAAGRPRARARLLEGAFATSVSRPLLPPLHGPRRAGVGKSRLAQEFLAAVGRTVVRGRCLSYGEGITYWPVTRS